MGYCLAFSKTFQKHFENFTEKQKRQIKNKLEILVLLDVGHHDILKKY